MENTQLSTLSQSTMPACIDLETFKSMYYILKAKRDTDIKLYDDDKSFTFDDFKELNRKIYTKLNNHIYATDMVNIVVGMKNKESISFGNWAQFCDYDWNTSQVVKYIALEWTFQINLPEKPVPQEHSIRIKIGNDLTPNEVISLLFANGNDIDIEEAQAQMACKIDFVNPQFCSELFSVVTEWYNALPINGSRGRHRMYKWLAGHDNIITTLIQSLLLLAGILCINVCYAILGDHLTQMPNGLQNIRVLSGGFLLLYIFYTIGKFLARHAFNKLAKLQRPQTIEITKGDKNAHSKIINRNKKLLYGIIKDFAIALVVNILCLVIMKML